MSLHQLIEIDSQPPARALISHPSMNSPMNSFTHEFTIAILSHQAVQVVAIDIGGGLPANYGSDDDGDMHITPREYADALRKEVGPMAFISFEEYLWNLLDSRQPKR